MLALIHKAMDTIESVSCLKFVQRTTEMHYIYYTDRSG